MPYIRPPRRMDLRPGATHLALSAGDLNFQITELCIAYFTHNGESYQTYNDILGALEGAKLELYARKIRAYEDKKIAENGDVW